MQLVVSQWYTKLFKLPSTPFIFSYTSSDTLSLREFIYLFNLFITGQTAPAGFAQGTEFVPNNYNLHAYNQKLQYVVFSWNESIESQSIIWLGRLILNHCS